MNLFHSFYHCPMQRTVTAAGGLATGNHADCAVETVETIGGGAGEGEIGEDILYHFFIFFR